ncbi:MAG TPA: protein-glutamate O-methyltransferase CheR [Rhodothermales bacterium]|nr:protein-glutamate O-methyltransferase CheR [Rhodothermales bacterium]
MNSLRDQRQVTRSNVHLEEHTFQWLRSFIYEKTGIHFQESKKYLLESRLGHRLAMLHLPDFDAYVELLRSAAALRELPHLINSITINETYFFRNEAHLSCLESSILPDLVARRESDGTFCVRFWSAACSTGDETYTIAMVVHHLLAPRYPHVRFEVVGTDINTDVLSSARRGVYGGRSVRCVPEAYLARYFREESGQFVISDEIRDMVRFEQMNLCDGATVARMRNVDVIVCANVLIYFNKGSKQLALASLHQALADHGYLLIGASEALNGGHPFTASHHGKSIVYQKLSSPSLSLHPYAQ